MYTASISTAWRSSGYSGITPSNISSVKNTILKLSDMYSTSTSLNKTTQGDKIHILIKYELRMILSGHSPAVLVESLDTADVSEEALVSPLVQQLVGDHLAQRGGVQHRHLAHRNSGWHLAIGGTR